MKIKDPKIKKNDGFAIVTAVFLIVVLSLIAGYIVALAAFTRTTINYTLSGVRASFAAQSGLQWGIRQALSHNSCSSSPVTLNLNEGGLRNFKASVTCTSNTYSVGGTNNLIIYQITSTATYSTLGNQDYVSRTWQMKVSQ